MVDILKLARIQIVLTVLFIVLKLIRPSVLQSDAPEFFKLFLLSAPNLFEGIVGTFVLTGLGLFLNDKLELKNQIKPNILYLLAVVLAGIYVITQEFKIHNLGGRNIYDQNDVIFSFIGLIIGYSIVVYIQPRIPAKV